VIERGGYDEQCRPRDQSIVTVCRGSA
jgi:hypothetical protein